MRRKVYSFCAIGLTLTLFMTTVAVAHSDYPDMEGYLKRAEEQRQMQDTGMEAVMDSFRDNAIKSLKQSEPVQYRENSTRKKEPRLELQSIEYTESLTFWGGIKHKMLRNIDVIAFAAIILILFGCYLEFKVRKHYRQKTKQ